LKARLTNVPSDADGLCREFVKFIPEIPNLDKWFPRTSCGELALIRAHVEKCESSQARDICFLALSRVVMRVSLQDSETRYTSVVKTIKPGETIARFLAALTSVVAKVAASSAELQYGIAAFHTADAKTIGPDTIPNEAVDLIVTSPPYGNANDYHLYHRFRMFWLGHDPRALGKIEIGSHLRHQKEGTGFDVYLQEMEQCLDVMHRVLKPGRYAALVLGDSIYRGETYNTADNLHGAAVQFGFEAVGTIARKIHRTKRSFAVAGRRA
jgi:hypothetical protein